MRFDAVDLCAGGLRFVKAQFRWNVKLVAWRLECDCNRGEGRGVKSMPVPHQQAVRDGRERWRSRSVLVHSKQILGRVDLLRFDDKHVFKVYDWGFKRYARGDQGGAPGLSQVGSLRRPRSPLR